VVFKLFFLVLCGVSSYYPLYPSHPDVPVDVEHFDVHCRLPVTPHLVVLPSDLRCFIKVTQFISLSFTETIRCWLACSHREPEAALLPQISALPLTKNLINA